MKQNYYTMSCGMDRTNHQNKEDMIMPILSIGGTILGVIKDLFGFKESLAKAKVERRARIADLLIAVGDCLEHAAADIRRGNYPSGRCYEIEQYAKDLPAKVDVEIGWDKAYDLGKALEEAHEVEQLFNERTKPEGERDLQKIEEAAGLFHALGNIVRV
jgi:hypothetical protein